MIKAIVTDIEGTTTSISFVSDVLFPYAKERIRSFIIENQTQPEVAKQIEAVREEISNNSASIESVADALEEWIEQDKKITPLKALQGLIWRTGYEDGSLKGHLYPEVKSVLESWVQQGMMLYVYSSGSVAAQKLLFGYSEQGDLTPLFNGYFDTNIGGKKEPESYAAICHQLSLDPKDVLFLSDIKAELDAAALAGVQTIALDRQCICDGFGSHPFVHDFRQIELDTL